MYLRKFPIFLHVLLLMMIETNTKRILGVFPSNERSHTILFGALLKGLAKRGHQVDVITHFEMKNPPKNYRTIINLNGTRGHFMNNVSIEICRDYSYDPISYYAFTAGNEICNLMSLEVMQNFIKNPPNDPPYDLVITQMFGANCYIGFGFILKVPVITITTNMGLPWAGDGVGNPPSTALYADLLMDTNVVSTFWDRLRNTMISHISKYRFYRYTEEAQTAAMRKYLSPEIPSIREIERSVALTLVNSYHSPFGIRPITPGLVEIGGIHIGEDSTKLSPELEQWMNESSHGVIYFTLGSMVLIETLPQDSLFAFYKSFSKISPMRVLMKIANESKLPPGLPDNVRTSPWIPQIPVLRHHNTKLFITHGGMLGVQEALHFKVPMIGLPLFSDQFRNVAALVNKSMAIQLDYKKITNQSLDDTLTKILNDAKYKEAAIRESHLFLDRPMSAMNTAIFWVEYIIRNGGNTLRSPAVDLHWCQVELLDVYGSILLCCIISIYAVSFIAKFVLQNFSETSKNFHKYKKNN